MTTFEDFCHELIDDLREDLSFKIQVLERDPALLESEAVELTKRLQDEFADDRKLRVIRLSLKEYEDFEGFFDGLVNAVFDAPGFAPEDAAISEESILKSSKEDVKRCKFKNLFSMDFAPNNIRHVFVVAYYEEAANRWVNGEDYGYLRSILDAIQGISAVFFTDKPMNEVSDEPKGSSPLWNIFTIPPTEISYGQKSLC